MKILETVVSILSAIFEDGGEYDPYGGCGCDDDHDGHDCDDEDCYD